MNHSLKEMLWVGAGLSIVFMALGAALQLFQSQNDAVKLTASYIQNQKHTVAYGKEELPRIHGSALPEPGHYSGVQVLHGMRGWASEGTEIMVDGQQIHSVSPDLNDPDTLYDHDLSSLLDVIDLSASYRFSQVREAGTGQMVIQFNKD